MNRVQFSGRHHCAMRPGITLLLKILSKNLVHYTKIYKWVVLCHQKWYADNNLNNKSILAKHITHFSVTTRLYELYTDVPVYSVGSVAFRTINLSASTFVNWKVQRWTTVPWKKALAILKSLSYFNTIVFNLTWCVLLTTRASLLKLRLKNE